MNSRIEHTNIPFFNKIATILLVVCPIIQTYGWGKYDFAFIATVVLSIIYILFLKPKNKIPKFLNRYLLYCCFSTLLSATSVSSLLQMSIVRIFLAYLLFFDMVDGDYLKKWYRRVVYFCIVFFFIQEAAYYGFGVRISGIFEFLPLAVTEDAADYYEKVMGWTRSASFYSEPSYLAQAVFPLLCFELFDKEKTKIKKSLAVLVLIIALLLMQSGTALFGLAAIFLYYIVFLIKAARKGANMLLLIISLVITIVVGSWYLSSSFGQYVMDRQDQLTLDASSGQSGFIRIFRGYFVYDNYDTPEKIFGLFNGEAIQKKINTSSVSYTFRKGDMSFNVIQNILLRTGIVGMVIIILLIISLWRNAPPESQALIAVICVMSFIEALYFKEMMTLYLVSVVKLKENK